MNLFRGQLYLIAFIWLVTIGCRHKTVNYVAWSPSPGATLFLEKERVYTDKALAKRIVIDEVIPTSSSDGLLSVQVKLRNLTSKLQVLEYRFEWYNRNGMIIDSPATRWGHKRIYGGDWVIIVGVAPNIEATDFVIKMKRR